MTERTCSIDGCEGPTVGRGWCRKHYNRWWKHGDPLALPPRRLPPQNLPRTIGCEADECAAKHFAKGFCRNHYQQAYYRANVDSVKATHKAYRSPADRRAKAAAVAKAWREANPDRMRELSQRYAQVNADRLREKRRAYRDANRDKIRALNNRRKALQRDVAVNDLTPAQWRQIVTDWGGRCAYCGCTPAVMTMDHVVPLSRDGHHTASNVVPACGPCNFRKSDGPAPPFVNPPT